jgi:hypothetical protein
MATNEIIMRGLSLLNKKRLMTEELALQKEALRRIAGEDFSLMFHSSGQDKANCTYLLLNVCGEKDVIIETTAGTTMREEGINFIWSKEPAPSASILALWQEKRDAESNYIKATLENRLRRLRQRAEGIEPGGLEEQAIKQQIQQVKEKLLPYWTNNTDDQKHPNYAAE